MTRLRKIMLEELERRNYSEGTTRCYLRAVADFARYFHRPPDQLRPEHGREYQAYLFRERKLEARSVTPQLAARRFFFVKTLRRGWRIDETPYPQKVRRLPTVLSQAEVAQLINSAPTPFYRILVRTLYATGARCAEAARLPVHDIDSQRRIVPIGGGKGRKDRDVMLSLVLLEARREHGRQLKPQGWLFPGGRGPTAAPPIGTKTLGQAGYLAAPGAGLHQPVHPHTLGPCLATHRHEAGADLRTLPLLLGHRDGEETALDLPLSSRRLSATARPLDALALPAPGQKNEPPGDE